MLRTLLATTFIAFGLQANAQDVPPPIMGEREYSPFPSQTFPNRVLFGDTHLHTSYSPDAGMIGNNLGPEEAFRYARGETVTSSMGVPTRLVRPLDFIVISDHAEGLGVAPMLKRNDPAVLDTEFGRELHAYTLDGSAEAAGAAWNLWAGSRFDGTNAYSNNPDFSRGPWGEIIDAAEAANEPGLFSAMIGFEWSSTPNGNNMHRVVIYRDGREVAESRVPLSADAGVDPEDLWDWMEALQEETGGLVLAIPHNGNLSNGLMFSDTRYGTGEPIDATYAERRMRWEPLYEVTQMKGDGEAHPFLSPDDEFADFETWDRGSFGADPKTIEMLPNEYARTALLRGLAFEEKLGTNPFQFGMIGSTDSHTSLPTTREDNFFGKVAQLEPTADPVRFEEAIAGRLGAPDNVIRAWETSASGLTAVWARDNTRAEIFDGMMRREVYATTGTRIRVRVFAGYDFAETDLPRSDFDSYGYDNGVPMGAHLPVDAEGQAPNFVIRALRDPDSANLDRIQIVKGWLNEDGTTAERVYDVACGDRAIIDGRCAEPVGDTVDEATATWTNDIGQAIMAAYWEDRDFDPNQRAFYYVRVLEIPTPRWTTFDAVIFGVERPEGAPISIQERAYTSPIWYTP